LQVAADLNGSKHKSQRKIVKGDERRGERGQGLGQGHTGQCNYLAGDGNNLKTTVDS